MPTSGEVPRGWAIVCHPHPVYGGSLSNKVVDYLSRTLTSLGMACVRFNFRGVGDSGGAYDGGRGEQDDLLAIIEWCRTQAPEAPVWLAGFSFGAYVAAAVGQRYPPDYLITVAPPVSMFDLSRFTPPPCPWVVVQGTDDDIVSYEAVETWVASMQPRPVLLLLSGATHFFHGKLNNLREQLVSVLQPMLA
jgi:alpha/beta superfamily hydrolase